MSVLFDEQEFPYAISIVVPAFNAENTLQCTLEAAAKQNFDNFQVVVVDDGSRDSTFELAKSFEKDYSFIKTVHQENKGTGGAYNTGVRNAEGEWIVICSADDILYPNALSTLWQTHLLHPEYDVVVSRGYYLFDDGEKAPSVHPTIKESREVNLKDAFTGCFYSVGAMYNRAWFDAVGGYNEKIYAEDYDFWLRIMMKGARVYYTDEIISLNRRGSFQKSADGEKVLKTDIAIFKKWLDSGKLPTELVEVCKASIENRQQRLRSLPTKKKTLKDFIISTLVKVFGDKKLEQIVHLLKGKL